MEHCPNCGCEHIGTDVLYSLGVAMFCQKCGVRGPRTSIDPDVELWLVPAEEEAKALWNEWAQSQTQPAEQIIHT